VEPTKEDDLDRPDTIAGPGALIMAVGTDFSAEKMAWKSRRNFASVRISAVASATPPARYAVLCEWKRCYAGSTESIAAQTQRMLRFIPDIELPKHGFSTKNWRIGFLWVCDVWDDLTKDWWHGHRPSTIVTPCPFDPTWSRGEYSFNGLKWSYAWIWAYKYK
jgi:hypothetical protein